jgi:hypothetical protein
MYSSGKVFIGPFFYPSDIRRIESFTTSHCEVMRQPEIWIDFFMFLGIGPFTWRVKLKLQRARFRLGRRF